MRYGFVINRLAQSGRLGNRRGIHVSCSLAQRIPFLLADIGEGIAEVEVLKWHIKVGDNVRQFDKIAEVQSDKATVEITSRYDGRVAKIHYETGATAKVGSPLIDVEVEGEAVVPSTKDNGPKQADETSERRETTNTSCSGVETIDGLKHVVNKEANVKAMPGVRHFARIKGVDIGQVRATGNSGQVTKDDVIAFMKEPVSMSRSPTITDPNQHTVVPLNTFQKAMSKSMQAALRIPHFGFNDEVAVDVLAGMRQSLVREVETRHGVKLTMLCFFIKALSLALTEYPILNSHFNPELQQLGHFSAHNVGVAVDTEHGLAVPVIKAVQDLSIIDIARELARLSAAARDNKLATSELSGGTITLSNIGTIGGTTANPVILAPQVCIAAFGRAQLLPRFNEHGQVIPKQIMPVSWSADHRVIDGATVARFSARWRSILEDPASLLLRLTLP